MAEKTTKKIKKDCFHQFWHPSVSFFAIPVFYFYAISLIIKRAKLQARRYLSQLPDSAG